MNDEITSGADILGALIMGHAYQSWWIGTDLTIEESRRLVPHQNATTMQVAISVVAADVDDRKPARGTCAARRPAARVTSWKSPSPTWASSFLWPSDWTPLKHYANVFSGFNKPELDPHGPVAVQEFLDQGWGLNCGELVEPGADGDGTWCAVPSPLLPG